MRAFKKLMAGMIATAIAATLATSAFAAGFDAETGKVTAEFDAVGQTTVLIVPAEVWEDDALASLQDSDILYIDQYEDADTANTAIAAGFGVKLDETGTLDEGKYYALFGSKSGDDFAITPVAFEVKADEEEPETKTIQLGECDGIDGIDGRDSLAVLSHISEVSPLTGDYLVAADCDGITGIDGRDVLAILSHIAETLTLGTVTIEN